MPKIRKIETSYTNFLQRNILGSFEGKPFTTDFLIEDSQQIADDILKDINRTAFVKTKDFNFHDFIDICLAPTVSKSYSQGNLNASVFQLILTHFILYNDKFIKKGTERFLHDKKSQEKMRQKYAGLEQGSKGLLSVSFAYFDDAGIPCGVSIFYSERDRSLWTATIIRNIMANPAERDVFFICPEDIVDAPNDFIGRSSQIKKLFLNFLNSKEVVNLLDGFLSREGRIKTKKLNLLAKELKIANHADYLSRIAQLQAQYAAMSNWNLTEAQFRVLTAFLQEKQEINQKLKIKREIKRKEEANLKKERIQDYNFDKFCQQSFLKRNQTALLLSSIALIILACALLIPGLTLPVLILDLFAFCTLIILSTIQIAMDEKSLAKYKQDLADLMPIPHHGDDLPGAATLINEKEQIKRAVLAANFSSHEFEQLIKAIDAENQEPNESQSLEEPSDLENEPEIQQAQKINWQKQRVSFLKAVPPAISKASNDQELSVGPKS